MLSWVEHEKSFYNLGAWFYITRGPGSILQNNFISYCSVSFPRGAMGLACGLWLWHFLVILTYFLNNILHQ